MIKAIVGDLLVVGLSSRNLDIFEADNDTYIRIKQEETKLPLDIIISSGDSFRAKGREQNKDIFIISLGMAELRYLRRKNMIDLKKEFFKIPVNIMIFGGETEDSMMSNLDELIGPKTKVVIDQRLKN